MNLNVKNMAEFIGDESGIPDSSRDLIKNMSEGKMDDTCFNVIPDPSKPRQIVYLTGAMLSNYILNGQIKTEAHIMISGKYVPLHTQSYLIPFGRLANEALQAYKNRQPFENLCHRYLDFMYDATDTPGLLIIHLLLYFSHRHVQPVTGFVHLLYALGQISEKENLFSTAQILNDLGVLLLLNFNLPDAAISLFIQAVKTEAASACAAYENLTRIAYVASSNNIEKPELTEAIDGISSKYKSIRRTSSVSDRPDPLHDQWALIIRPEALTAAVLLQAKQDSTKRKEAVVMFMKALESKSSVDRAAMMSLVNEAIPVLGVFNEIEQNDLQVERENKQRHCHEISFLEQVQAYHKAFKEGRLDEAENHIKKMKALAVTDAQNKLVEHFWAGVIQEKALGGDPDSIHTNPIMAQLDKHRHEDTQIQDCIAKLNHLIEINQFEQATESFEYLCNFESTTDQQKKYWQSKLLSFATRYLADRLRTILAENHPDFKTAQDMIDLAGRLKLEPAFITWLETQLQNRREKVLQRRVREAIAKHQYDDAVVWIANEASEISSSVRDELHRYTAQSWQTHRDQETILEEIKELIVNLDGPSNQPATMETLLAAIKAKMNHHINTSTLEAWQVIATAQKQSDLKGFKAAKNNLLAALTKPAIRPQESNQAGSEAQKLIHRPGNSWLSQLLQLTKPIAYRLTRCNKNQGTEKSNGKEKPCI